MLNIVTLILGALLGVIGGLTVQWLKSGRDELRSACDLYCKTIEDAADLASVYWLDPGDHSDAALREVRLIGFQRKLSGQHLLVTSRLHALDSEEISEQLSLLFDALTGGSFQETARTRDVGRARLVQEQAAKTATAIRLAFPSAVSAGATSGRISRRTKLICVGLWERLPATWRKHAKMLVSKIR